MLPARLNIACWVTLSRLMLLPVALLSVYLQWPHGWSIAAGACAAAGLSDVLDGYLARRIKCVTDIGSVLDLLADKIFVIAMLFVLASQNAIPYWMPAVVVLREIIISLMRLRRIVGRRTFSADRWGKAKTVITMVAVTGLLLRQDFYLGGPLAQISIPLPISPILELAWWAMLLAVALTIFSGANYVVSYIGLVRED
ncbi:MAG: CDP-diacylglycerol--glycerol-3-phosphate 3-phosphatidyltransferase [Chloroflexota bacterium]|nr:MAG: CDP-diacylglycerol--glycerol-3-phosphate 3-phosphatidyltransferase [Chloroflexota bacterium]